MKNIEIMIDIETLSVRPKAVITQIAAAMVDKPNGFNKYIKIDSCLKYGGLIDESSLLFTAKHNLLSIINDYEKIPLSVALADLEYEIESSGFEKENEDHKIWTYGPQFDITILESWYNYFKSSGSPEFISSPPWSYRQIRDLRTLVKETPNLDNNKLNELKTGNHNALHDCLSQINMLKYVRSVSGI